LCTTVVYNTTQNSSDNLPSYLQTNTIAHRLRNCPRLRIEVLPTVFRTETLNVTLTLTSYIDLQYTRGMVITHTHAKGQGQRSISSKVKSKKMD